MLHIRDIERPKKTGSVETRLEEMEQRVFKCQRMVERGLSANHTMITEFTSNHKMDAIDIGKHLSRLYDRVDQLQGQIYDLQNQNWIADKKDDASSSTNEIYLDCEAFLSIHRTISPEVFKSISTCKSAHEVWTKLEDIYGGSNLDEDDIMMKELVHELFTLFDHKESTTTSISDCLHTSASSISQGEIKKYEVLLTNEESDSPKESSSTPPVHMCLMARGNNEVSSSLCNNDDICDEDDDDDLTENIYVISKILHKAKNNALQRFQDVLAYFENCNDSLNHEQAKSEQLEHEIEKSHQTCRDLRSSKGEIEVAHDKLKKDFEVAY
ncbi:40s ribosomal protein s5-1 [Hordeum vulgare]|nr:40s ribosomal protein s5-1 [Hordeum vulgare]